MRRWTIIIGLVILFVLLIFYFSRSGIINQEKLIKLFFRKQKQDIPENVYKSFGFSSEQCLKGWKNKIFKGKTRYWIDQQNGARFLHSNSEDSASAFYHLLSYKVEEYPILRWSWRPVKFPVKAGIKDPQRQDDYALRIYVVFASAFFANFKCIEYVWDEFLPEGTEMFSPFSDNIRQIVIESGPGTGRWVTEQRNVWDDYEKLFGQKPKQKVKAIAIMSDSEGSHDLSEANFKDIKIIKPNNS